MPMPQAVKQSTNIRSCYLPIATSKKKKCFYLQFFNLLLIIYVHVYLEGLHIFFSCECCLVMTTSVKWKPCHCCVDCMTHSHQTPTEQKERGN